MPECSNIFFQSKVGHKWGTLKLFSYHLGPRHITLCLCLCQKVVLEHIAKCTANSRLARTLCNCV